MNVRLVQVIARIIHHESLSYGERRIAWDAEPDDVRDTFRQSAERVLDALPRGTLSADRVLVGHCPSPDCSGAPLVVLNNRESWPLVDCPCGWAGPTTDLVNRSRLDRGWLVSDEHGQERELRP